MCGIGSVHFPSLQGAVPPLTGDRVATGEGVEKTCRKVSHAYVQGLTWVLAYYVHGNTPAPVSTAHLGAIEAAKGQLHGKGKHGTASDSTEGMGAAWDW